MPDPIDIPGIAELWTHTTGDPRVTVVVIDGRADLERACFQGARLTAIEPYWCDGTEPEIDARYRAEYRRILDEDDERFAEYERSGRPIRDAVAEREAELAARIPLDILFQLELRFHATHISSIIFGQHGSPVDGIAPRCRGINIPIAASKEEIQSPLLLTRAIDLAAEMGAQIIHVAIAPPTKTGQAHDLLARAVRQCLDNNILVVAPAGNDEGANWVIPAILPGVLAVGAMKETGEPFKFSNWGGRLQEQGILAPGDNILGAQLDTDEPVRKKGTSCAAPVVTSLCALLMSLQRQRGQVPNAAAIRAAVLHSATPCDPTQGAEPERCLAGKLNISGAFQKLTGEPLRAHGAAAPAAATGRREAKDLSGSGGTRSAAVTASGHANQVRPSAEPAVLRGRSNLIYAIGTLGYDFGTEARRDAFKQLMPSVLSDGVRVADPQEARHMTDYLAEVPTEASSLIWTLNQDLTPIYAIEPIGPFAADVYGVLLYLLAGQLEPERSESLVERVAVPGRLTARSVELLSGQLVPVIELEVARGLHGWQVSRLIDAAMATIQSRSPPPNPQAIRRSLESFLQRIYHDLRNPGRTSRDRALNHAGTNIYQAASSFADAVATGMELDRIDVDKSSFCRLESDCWDVRLTFFDPENGHRGRRVFRFTIDVSDIIPVTLGEIRTWSISS